MQKPHVIDYEPHHEQSAFRKDALSWDSSNGYFVQCFSFLSVYIPETLQVQFSGRSWHSVSA